MFKTYILQILRRALSSDDSGFKERVLEIVAEAANTATPIEQMAAGMPSVQVLPFIKEIHLRNVASRRDVLAMDQAITAAVKGINKRLGSLDNWKGQQMNDAQPASDGCDCDHDDSYGVNSLRRDAERSDKAVHAEITEVKRVVALILDHLGMEAQNVPQHLRLVKIEPEQTEAKDEVNEGKEEGAK